MLRLLRYGCGVPVGLIWKFPVPLLGIAVISLWYCCVIPVGVAGVFLGYSVFDYVFYLEFDL